MSTHDSGTRSERNTLTASAVRKLKYIQSTQDETSELWALMEAGLQIQGLISDLWDEIEEIYASVTDETPKVDQVRAAASSAIKHAQMDHAKKMMANIINEIERLSSRLSFEENQKAMMDC